MLSEQLRPGVQFFPRDQALLNRMRLEGMEKPLVVARRKIAQGFHTLDDGSPWEAHAGELLDQAPHPHHPALPRLVEHRLVPLDLHPPEPVHATHIMDTVHRPLPLLTRAADPCAAARASPGFPQRLSRGRPPRALPRCDALPCCGSIAIVTRACRATRGQPWIDRIVEVAYCHVNYFPLDTIQRALRIWS